MIYAVKKQNESNERLFSRFKKLVQRSRIVYNKKKHRYHEQTPRKTMIRQSAVMRATHRKARAKKAFYSS